MTRLREHSRRVADLMTREVVSAEPDTPRSRPRAQASRNWKVVSHIYRDANGRASVKVETRDRNGAPLTKLAVTVRFARPANQRADRIVSLAEHESGDYVGQATDAAPAVWDVELDADHGAEREFRSEKLRHLGVADEPDGSVPVATSAGLDPPNHRTKNASCEANGCAGQGRV